MPTRQEHINNYYKYYSLARIPDKKKILKDQELYQLYKIPKGDKKQEIVHFEGTSESTIAPQAIYQCDCLYLPDDKGFRHCLVVVDVATGETDAEPFKMTANKKDASKKTIPQPEPVLEAFKKIINRKPLKGFQEHGYILQCDNGQEFKGVFKKYVNDTLHIRIRYGLAGRSRQQAYAESRNKSIGRALFHKMTQEELITGQTNTEWVDYLPTVIEAINKYLAHRKKPKPSHTPYITKKTVLLDIGQEVRLTLNKPKSVLGRNLSGNFRATDIRWDMEPKKITNIIINDDQPPLYQVDNMATAYTRNQLQPIINTEHRLPENPNLLKLIPPKSNSKKQEYENSFIIYKIKGKKKSGNRVYYQVQWKGFPQEQDWTWEPKTTFMRNETLRGMVKKYENSL